MKKYYFQMKGLTVGYDRKPLIRDIHIDIEKGEMVALIGPNGSGKSTILKSITRQLALISGKVYVAGKDLKEISHKHLSQEMAVVLTDRIRPELMTCQEIVATGRYPYTGRLGRLTDEDERKVDAALGLVHAKDLGNRDFNAISDGQRQRVLLARAICQEPDIIILDEPTSFLDIRHKLELLFLLRSMAKEKGITVIMSLHEIDLAQKIADKIVCVKGDFISHFGCPEEIFQEDTIRNLYEIDNGFYDPLFGNIEFPQVSGKPQIFVISGGGGGIPLFRRLQREGTPFAAGILFENDVEYPLAKKLAVSVISEKPFSKISKESFEKALKVMKTCGKVIACQVPRGGCNEELFLLMEKAREMGNCCFYS